MLVTSICPAPRFCHCKHHSHFLLEMYILVLLLLFALTILRHATPPANFVTEPWMRCQNVRPYREWCAMTFISDRGYDVRPRGEIAAKKKRIDLTLRKLWRLITQRVDFTEMWNLPHLKRLAGSVGPYLKMGKSCTPGGQERPKVAPLTVCGVGPSNHPEHPSNRLATP